MYYFIELNSLNEALKQRKAESNSKQKSQSNNPKHKSDSKIKNILAMFGAFLVTKILLNIINISSKWNPG